MKKLNEFKEQIIDSSTWEEGESLVLETMFFMDEYNVPPLGVRIQLTQTDIINIKEALDFLQNKDTWWSINIRCFSDVVFLHDCDEMEVNENWKSDVMNYIVYKDNVYFFAQNKWDARDQIETESFVII
jgi:hypothetical protein